MDKSVPPGAAKVLYAARPQLTPVPEILTVAAPAASNRSIAAALVAIVGAAAWLASVPCSLFGVMCQ